MLLTDKHIIIGEFDLTQIINGKEIMSPSPFTKHQKLITRLYDAIENYLETNKIGGETLLSPLDVIFEEHINRVQPDLIHVAENNLDIIQDWIRGVPNLLVEVVSKSSFNLDTIDKKNIYEKYGVQEYWIVFPEFNSVEVYTLKNGKYELHVEVTNKGKMTSVIFDKFELDIEKLFYFSR